MADQDLVAKILADYPAFAFLINDPEIGPLLLAAVNPDQGFDAATFQAKLINTNWWKTTQSSQRQWETLANTDPATAQAQKDSWKFTLNQMATRAGVQLKPEDLEWWANYYLPMGIQANDPRMQAEIARVYNQRTDLRIGSEGAPAGEIAATRDQIVQLAAAYLRDLSDADLDYWQYEIASGAQTIAGLQTVLKNQAKDRFGYYASEIDQGSTPAALFGDRRDAIARELEVDPSSIDLLRDPRWSQVLGVPGVNGQTRAMTYAESIVLARSQPEWAKTNGARAQGADLTANLLKTFGATA